MCWCSMCRLSIVVSSSSCQYGDINPLQGLKDLKILSVAQVYLDIDETGDKG